MIYIPSSQIQEEIRIHLVEEEWVDLEDLDHFLVDTIKINIFEPIKKGKYIYSIFY